MLALDAEAGTWPALAPLRVMALYFRTLYALDRRDYDRGEALAREGLAVARAHGDVSGAGNMLTELGHVAEARGDLDAAMALFEESLAQYRAGGERLALGRTLSSVGNLARARGDYASARRYLEEALDWARKLHFSWAIASILTSLGHVAVEQGDAARARPLYRESLELYRGMRNPSALAWCLEGVAVVAEKDGRHERVARLCGTVSGLRAAAGVAEATAAWLPFARACEAARQVLGEEGFAAAQAAGAALSPERAIAYALAERNAPARSDRSRDGIRP
jgi:tetratricopeptide (TPR) repeat protein